MDPNALLELLDKSLQFGEIEGAKLLADELDRWLSRGGFAPDYSRHPKTCTWMKMRKMGK